MRKGTDIINKTIVAYDTGEKFSRVKDLIFDQNDNQLLGLLIEESGFLRGAKVLLLKDVKAIGLDAIIAPSKKSVISASKSTLIQQILKRNNVLKGTQIMTTDGRNLGRMIDLYFDDQTGVVEGYEVSGGLFADAYTGRSFMPAPQTIKIGEDVAFVPPEVSQLMEEQVGGIKGAMLTANEKIQEAAQATSDTVQSATQEAGYKLQEVKRQAELSVANAIVEPTEQKAFVVGKVAADDVLTVAGVMVVGRGQIIRLLDANQAEEAGVLDQLYRSTGGSIRQDASDLLQVAAQQTGDRLQVTAQQTSDRLQVAAQQTSDRLQVAAQQTGDRLQSAASQAGEQIQQGQRGAIASITNTVVNPETQKTFAIGKVAQWSVATPNGTLIIVANQVVTAGIAETAAQLNVLDELYRATGGRIAHELTRKADSVVAGYVVEQSQGRRVQSVVRAPDGFIVAAEGQIVTESVIARAKTHRVERGLLEAVGLSPGTATRDGASTAFAVTSDRLGSTAQNISEQLYYGAEQVKGGARDLWTQLKETTDTLQEQWEERRVKGALGRPVMRVILDAQDNVILNVGDLITHHAIAIADQAGVLDILLNSVYTQTPKLSQADLRAPQPAIASLEAVK